MTKHYCPKPIIVAANGKVFGGGAEMLLAADIALISSDGLIGFPETSHALFPGGGGAPLRIGRSIHLKHATELLLTGRPIDAELALAWGLVNRAVDEEKLLDEALDIAQAIIANGPVAIRMTKLAIYDCMDKSFISESDGWRMMSEFDAGAKRTEDAQEGTLAFSQKRKPEWKGR
jgi:crotonobetainyl-CoA hydratase